MLLSVKDLQASYGVAEALFGVDLQIDEGQVLALMGRNGMGKTTTVKSICQMLPTKGEITFEGKDLSRLPSHKVARLGIGLVPEGRRCFADLTVMENLLAVERKGNWNVETLSDFFPRLGERLSQKAATLSGGEQQMLAIGRALITNPKLLILDEATEGLAPTIRNDIWKTIRRLKEETGMAILLIDKSVKELRTVCDRAVILERGQSVWSGNMEEFTAKHAEQYLGV